MLQHGNTAPTLPDRVVVVGAGGFVGHAIVARLVRDNVPTLGLTRREVDLLSPGAAAWLERLLRPGDVLVAVAALAPCRTVDMLRDNMILAAAIITAAAAMPLAHVVNISSDAVYADAREPLTEASAKAPYSLHGVMHLAREVMFSTAIRAPLVMLRPSLIYGASDPHNGYGPNRFRRLAAAGDPIVVFGEGEERRDHVYIDDVAELATRVIYRRSTGTLNIATGTVASFREIAELTVHLSERKVPIRHMPRAGPIPHNGYRPFDPTACHAAFPDFRYTPLAEGLAKASADNAYLRHQP